MGFSPPWFPSAGNGAYTNDLVLVRTDIEGKVKVLACLDAYANMIYRVRSRGLWRPRLKSPSISTGGLEWGR
jgi:hypothetical protein